MAYNLDPMEFLLMDIKHESHLLRYRAKMCDILHNELLEVVL